MPCHQLAHVRGKNAADIALAIDAVDLSYRERLDGFVLVSSDSDFTRLAQRLREGGFAVYGFGESKTPRAFRSACHRFGTVGKGLRPRAAEGEGYVQDRETHWHLWGGGDARDEASDGTLPPPWRGQALCGAIELLLGDPVPGKELVEAALRGRP